MHREADVRLQDSLGLRRALAGEEFTVAYQPILELSSGRTVGLEALIRWNDPDRGLLYPDAFLPAAEETGLASAIGQWVLETALTDLAKWRAAEAVAADLWVAVNFSPRQLPDLVEQVTQSLAVSGVPATAVHLEITESAVMNDLEPVLTSLESLRAAGVALAVDDFGTGYSSLSYLKRLPVTSVKIDRSFVRGLGGADDPFDRPIVDAIIRMAQSLHLEVIAEGVENAEQLSALRALGAQYAQGFLWAPALPADEIPAWLAQ
ncbi:MAG: EAL domain-containing protein [Candidatus Nanopelagicales bacterium]